jgi:hypothetical protein
VEAAFRISGLCLANEDALCNHSLPVLPTGIIRRVFRLIAMETTQAATENPMAQKDSRA